MSNYKENFISTARGFFSKQGVPLSGFMDIYLGEKGIFLEGSRGFAGGLIGTVDSTGESYEIPWIQFESISKKNFRVLPGAILETKDGTEYKFIPVNALGKWNRKTRNSFIDKVLAAKPTEEALKAFASEETAVKAVVPEKHYIGGGNPRCIKCESKENLKPLEVKAATKAKFKKRTFGADVMTVTYDIHNLPVCGNCLKMFNKVSIKSGRNFMIHFILIIVWGLVFTFHYYFESVLSGNYTFNDLIFYIIPGIIIAISYITVTIVLRKNEFNPKKYMKFKSNGRCYIKTANSKKWIIFEEWINLM